MPHQTGHSGEAVVFREERPSDAAAVFEVNRAAFGRDVEAKLVDALRAAGDAVVSLVAEVDGEIVGHVLFSPVSVAGESARDGKRGVGLAPVAVRPGFQRRGIGARLIEAGLAACRAGGFDFAVVLGEPGYYRRFGFRRAQEFGLGNEYGADEAFMAMALREGGLPERGGLVRYARAIGELDG